MTQQTDAILLKLQYHQDEDDVIDGQGDVMSLDSDQSHSNIDTMLGHGNTRPKMSTLHHTATRVLRYWLAPAELRSAWLSWRFAIETRRWDLQR